MDAFIDWAHKWMFRTQTDREAQCIIDLVKACMDDIEGMGKDLHFEENLEGKQRTGIYYLEGRIRMPRLYKHVPASILFKSDVGDREGFGTSSLQATCELPDELQAQVAKRFDKELPPHGMFHATHATVTNKRYEESAVNGLCVVTLRIDTQVPNEFTEAEYDYDCNK
jgi:hypothetical protein